MIKPRPTVEAIRNRISYNPETGEVHWKYDKTQHHAWLGRYPGKLAGCTHKVRKYRYLKIDGRPIPIQCVIWAYMTGEWPPSQVDHEDLDSLNNKWVNLRLATPSQNKANMGKPKTNTSGIKGVSLDPQTGKWRARIKKDGVSHNLGFYLTKEEAAAAYKAGAISHFGEFARTE